MATRYKWAKHRITTSVDYNMSWASDHDVTTYKDRESEVFGSSYTVTGEKDSLRLNNTKTVKGADMDSSLKDGTCNMQSGWLIGSKLVSKGIDTTIWYTTGRVNNYVEVEKRGLYWRRYINKCKRIPERRSKKRILVCLQGRDQSAHCSGIHYNPGNYPRWSGY